MSGARWPTLNDADRSRIAITLRVMRDRTAAEGSPRVAEWWSDLLCDFMDEWKASEAHFDAWSAELAAEFVWLDDAGLDDDD